jgi:hypothetical protein
VGSTFTAIGVQSFCFRVRAGEESRMEGITALADDYIVKPFAARELVARVETHLALSRVRRETEERIWSAGCRPFPCAPFSANGILPPLHSGQIPLDDSDQSWQHRCAIVASLRPLIGLLPEP